jgi:DNA polymerase-4
MWHKETIRGLGLRCTDLYTPEIIQLSLFEKDWSKQKKINITIDEIRIKFGRDSIVRGAFLWSPVPAMQGGISDDYPGMSSIL